jgi:nucleoid-associated protein YgaU
MYHFLLFAFLFLAGQASAQKIETIPVVVERGEQLGTIAERYFKRPAYINWREIAKLNNLKTTPYTIYPGMVLNLPAHSVL